MSEKIFKVNEDFELLKEVSREDFQAKHTEICEKIMETFKRKNHDYGNVFEQTMGDYGLLAPVVRFRDKLGRIETLLTVKNKVITMLLSGITYKQKELGRELTEQECLDVISKELKQEKEALDMSQGREDKVAELQAEIAILESYLPKQMSAEEVAAKVSELIAAAGLEPIVKNKGMIMKTVMAELKGKADGKVIGAAVDALLS